MTDQPQREAEIIDGVERPNAQHKVICGLFRFPGILGDDLPFGLSRERGSRIAYLKGAGNRAHSAWPFAVGATDQQPALEPPLLAGNAIEAVLERSLVEKQLDALALGAVAPKRSQAHVEQYRHGGACALPRPGRQAGVKALVP